MGRSNLLENRAHFEGAIFLLRGIGHDCLPSQRGAGQVVPEDIIEGDGLGGGWNTGSVYFFESFHVFQNVGKLLSQLFLIMLAQSQTSKDSDMVDFFAAQFHLIGCPWFGRTKVMGLYNTRESAAKLRVVIQMIVSPLRWGCRSW